MYIHKELSVYYIDQLSSIGLTTSKYTSFLTIYWFVDPSTDQTSDSSPLVFGLALLLTIDCTCENDDLAYGLKLAGVKRCL